MTHNSFAYIQTPPHARSLTTLDIALLCGASSAAAIRRSLQISSEAVAWHKDEKHPFTLDRHFAIYDLDLRILPLATSRMLSWLSAQDGFASIILADQPNITGLLS